MIKRKSAAEVNGVIGRTPKLSSSVFTRFVGFLEADPRQQARMSLGLFSKQNPPKGFCVAMHPDPEAPESVTSRISSPFGSPDNYELMLQIANYGDRKVQVEVWQM